MTLQDLIPTLQVAIGPVILISGVGLLLLSMTNRFGRIIDRSRHLTLDHRPSSGAQIEILLKRAVILRMAITLASLSVLMVALLIVTLFLGALLNFDLMLLVAGLFIACMLALIASVILFIADLNLSLTALKLEIGALERIED